MEKLYTKAEVEVMLNKAILDGKIKALKYCSGYIEFLINPTQEQFDYIQENGWTYSENFIELNGRLSALLNVKNQIEKTITNLETKKAQ
ncbi:MAG: hypothetical protein JNK27_16735 [Chitinophagaceae bacterium]|nr:hypothetical protein [Chitinophagaceae bacterium]